MNKNDQMKKGFKTFLLTLSVSLIVFSVVYYVITNSSSSATPYGGVGLNPDIESQDKPEDAPQAATPDTIFNTLASQKMDVPGSAVLAATDTNQTTQSTGTPDGGVTSITIGLVVSVAVFLLGLFIISKDPRKAALMGFEKHARRD
jgi:hypothetical protein